MVEPHFQVPHPHQIHCLTKISLICPISSPIECRDEHISSYFIVQNPLKKNKHIPTRPSPIEYPNDIHDFQEHRLATRNSSRWYSCYPGIPTKTVGPFEKKGLLKLGV